MVPVIWAFFSADVNAGTARAARIAIIAITTSNSISVNAEMIFLIFIVGFLFCGCSEGFLRGFVLGVFLRFWGGSDLNRGLSQGSETKSITIFDFFGGAKTNSPSRELPSHKAT